MNFIHDICKKYNITNYTINPDGSIDVVGNVNLYNEGLTELPLTFNRVMGCFSCRYNKLTRLKGSPRWVSGDFSCVENNLTSLEGCPISVGSWFSCSNNQLTNLEFGPEYVGGYFDCENNYLTDNYCDTEISGSFYTTLKQDGLIIVGLNKATNYKEWRKLYKRKLILENIFSKNLDI